MRAAGFRSKLPKSLLALLLGLTAAAAPACHKTNGGDTLAKVIAHHSRKTLTAFDSDADLSRFLKDMAKAQARSGPSDDSDGSPQPGAQAEAPAQAAPPSPAPTTESASASKSSDESVTNTQHAGVDEGGIVKLHGNHLVVLRRGRLFTVSVGGGELAPISAVNAFGPDIDPSGTWYDEMLVGDNSVVVVGYSYSRGGTELGLFDLDGAGKLAYRATYHLRSNDYYSSRNYASRLIGDKLIFYTPLYLSVGDDNPFQSFPALRKWRKGAKDTDFRRIVSATRVYRPIQKSSSLTLHTVTVCDLAKRELACEATAVLGPAGRVFYVSPGSVYVWASDYEQVGDRSLPRAVVYRMPLDGSGPSALEASGSPVDQFSFLEDPEGYLNVLVRADAAGDGMWNAEVTGGDVALMRVRLESFSDGADKVPASRYRSLPKPKGYTFQNRFVGKYLLYGTGSGWGEPESVERGGLVAYRYDGSAAPARLPLSHGVDRIEALGVDAVVIGTDGKDLHFSPIALGQRPSVAKRYTRKDASQGELRSHGFFYKPLDEKSGMLGLPVAEAGRPGYEHLTQGSASVLFLRNDLLRFTELGTLGARPEQSADDGCRASCVDWYGNARPLFLRGRVFALLGYELVEGDVGDGRIREKRRVSFAPSLPKIAR
ncbi:MAG: beta-propeller domain-containing protein [Myxococcales bacterium]|nr:beta-propeller domain-containing protein [Myxococcales bacterium]